jgi:hypothetical protein
MRWLAGWRPHGALWLKTAPTCRRPARQWRGSLSCRQLALQLLQLRLQLAVQLLQLLHQRVLALRQAEPWRTCVAAASSTAPGSTAALQHCSTVRQKEAGVPSCKRRALQPPHLQLPAELLLAAAPGVGLLLQLLDPLLQLLQILGLRARSSFRGPPRGGRRGYAAVQPVPPVPSP